MQRKWHESACRLLQLPDSDTDLPDYIGQIITWKKTNVIHLCQYLETIFGQSWIEILANSWHISEYVLYGIFVDRILQDKSARKDSGIKIGN